MKILPIVAVFLVCTGITAVAQKPALVKDMDANGRVPYVHTAQYTCVLSNPGACGSQTFSFPPVPTGYRLVVTYVSARFTADQPSNMSVLLTNGLDQSDSSSADVYLMMPTCPVQNEYKQASVSHRARRPFM